MEYEKGADMLLAAFAVPHPPIIVPGVGRGEEAAAQRTIQAYHQVAARIAKLQPELIVIATPHGPLYADAFNISDGSAVWGDFSEFRDRQDRLGFTLDAEFTAELSQLVTTEQLPLVKQPLPGNKLDHGCLLPLYFIAEHWPGWATNREPADREPADREEPPGPGELLDSAEPPVASELASAGQPTDLSGRIARIGISFLSGQQHYRLGQLIAQAADGLQRRWVFIASGDLSHKLPGSHYGFDPAGPWFDQEIVQIFSTGEFNRLLSLDAQRCAAAAECGLNSFIMMAGALNDYQYQSELLAHEGPWGVGYGVASISVTTPAESAGATLPVRLAWAALNDLLDGPAPTAEPAEPAAQNTPRVQALIDSLNPADQQFYHDLCQRQAGCFVSFHRGEELRGCIGTIAATCPSLWQEIRQNAVSAATRDPRFPAIQAAELAELSCSVDILAEAEAVSSLAELDARRYGVIVSRDWRRGLLLPDLEGVDTPAAQIAIALSKAGISPHESYRLERFTVTRYE